MPIIPFHSALPPTLQMQLVLDLLPTSWVDDGLSYFPDSIFGWSIRIAGQVHDARYCTRLWDAGVLDRAWREESDAELGRHVRALLPWGLRLAGYLVFLATYELGGAKAFGSCGRKAYGPSKAQKEAGLCRHGCPMPAWMLALV